MTRGIGAIDALRSVLPEAGIDAFALLTHLGDPFVVLCVLVLVYWLDDREAGAVGLGLLLGGFALVVGLKAGLAMPRPPRELHAVAADGYGFPSGHALGTTVGAGLAASTSGVGSRRARLGLASLWVALVSLSRVAIGVHYAVDVLAGVVVGLSFLWIARRATGQSPTRAFGLGGGLAVFAFGVAPGVDAATILGAAVGGIGVLARFDLDFRRDRVRALPAVGGLGGLAVAFGLGQVSDSVLVAAVAAAAGSAFVLLFPRLLDRR